MQNGEGKTGKQTVNQCAACNGAMGAGSRRDETGNWLCMNCWRELQVLSGGSVDAPPPPPPRYTVSPNARAFPLQSAPSTIGYQSHIAPKPKSGWEEFAGFRWMVSPVLIRGSFWVGSVLCVVFGIYLMCKGMYDGTRDHYYYASRAGMLADIFSGLGIMVLGPVVLRVYAEFLIVVFRIHDALNHIQDTLENRE